MYKIKMHLNNGIISFISKLIWKVNCLYKTFGSPRILKNIQYLTGSVTKLKNAEKKI